MGAQLAKLKRAARTPTASIKNVEKALETKSMSPRHPSTVKAIDEMVKANPQFETAAKDKNENLHTMLESLHVKSVGAAPSDVLRTGKRAKKLNIVPPGRLSIDQLNQLFLDRKLTPDEWTYEKISQVYNIDEDVARNLLTYFSSFRIYKTPKDFDITKSKNFLQQDDGPTYNALTDK